MYKTFVHRSRRLLASAERSNSRLISDIFHECGESAYTLILIGTRNELASLAHSF